MDPINPKDKRKFNSYLKYSGLGFQFAAVIVFSFFCGQWVDMKLNMSKPLFTLLFVLVFFCGFLYRLYIELNNEK